MLQARRDALDDALGIRLVPRDVRSERVQDEHLPPLRALVERGQQLVHVVRVELEDALRVPADASLISVSAATALATTIGLASASSSRSWSTNPRSSTSSGLMSCSFATQIAAVFRTYGSSSVSVRCSGSHRYSVIFSTRMHPIVRTARARIKRIGVRGILHERVHGEDGELGLASKLSRYRYTSFFSSTSLVCAPPRRGRAWTRPCRCSCWR